MVVLFLQSENQLVLAITVENTKSIFVTRCKKFLYAWGAVKTISWYLRIIYLLNFKRQHCFSILNIWKRLKTWFVLFTVIYWMTVLNFFFPFLQTECIGFDNKFPEWIGSDNKFPECIGSDNKFPFFLQTECICPDSKFPFFTSWMYYLF